MEKIAFLIIKTYVNPNIDSKYIEKIVFDEDRAIDITNKLNNSKKKLCVEYIYNKTIIEIEDIESECSNETLKCLNDSFNTINKFIDTLSKDNRKDFNKRISILKTFLNDCEKSIVNNTEYQKIKRVALNIKEELESRKNDNKNI